MTNRVFNHFPSWALQAVLAILISCVITWVTWATNTSMKHEVRINSTDVRIDALKEDISEIKEGQKDMNRKLDTIIERGR